MAIKGVGLIDPVVQWSDSAGVPLAGGSVTFYATGTLNLLNVYSDVALSVPLPNPVPLNAAGRTSTTSTGTATGVYYQQQPYDYVVKDATGVTIVPTTTFAGSQWPGQVQGQAVLSPAANANGYTNRFTTTINKASAGTHSLFAGTRFDIPTIGAGASTLTEADTVYIEGAPAAGTTASALHVAAGATRLDGPTYVQSVQVAGIPAVNSFRLSATTGLAVTTADVLAVGQLYFTPYIGNVILLYNGSSWDAYTSAEVNFSVLSAASTMNDVFVYASAGILNFDLVPWTNDTTRATALTTQDGILVKSGTPARRYVGTFRTTTVIGQTEDSFANRLIWNYYNRVMRPMRVVDTTDIWVYAVATWRQARATATNQLGCVIGVAEVNVNATVISSAFNDTASKAGLVGIGLNSTSALAAGVVVSNSAEQVVNLPVMNTASLSVYPAVGYNTIVWLEYVTGGNGTYLGDNGGTTPMQSGIFGTLSGG